MRAEGIGYFTGQAMFYNTIDGALIIMYIVLFPCVVERVGWLPEIAAVTDFLLLVKLAKLSRGHERLSFLYTMIEEVTVTSDNYIRFIRVPRAVASATVIEGGALRPQPGLLSRCALTYFHADVAGAA